MMKFQRRFRIIVLQLLVLILPLSFGLPTFLLDSARPRCISVEAPVDTILVIQYAAPDTDREEKDGKVSTMLTVNTVPSKRVMDTVLHMSPVKTRLKPLAKTITDAKGTIVHHLEVDGTANICIRSPTASTKRPQRFGLRVEISEQDPNKLTSGKTADLDKHLTHMEIELKRITMAMHHVLKEADFNKDQDALFHKQTLAMHSATTFWPIVQVCILLITGFTQANHIVRFFKSRRII